MAFVFEEMVAERTATTGTGDITPAGAVEGMRSFAGAGLSGGDQFYLMIRHPETGDWESSEATWTSSLTIERTTVIAGSNGTSHVDFQPGWKQIYCYLPVSRTAHVTSSGALGIDGQIATGGVDIQIYSQLHLPAGAAEGSTILGMGVGGAGHYGVYAVGNLSWGAGATGFLAGANSVTGSSIRVAGTVDASGADYAEYRRVIESLWGQYDAGGVRVAGAVPGDILAADAAGKMTNIAADVVGRFYIKSTQPGLVGNGAWSCAAAIIDAHGIEPVGAEPVEPKKQAEWTADDFAAARDDWITARAAWEARRTAFTAALEAERRRWDRMAISGIVPVNVTGLTSADVGRWLVPCAAQDGSITAMARDLRAERAAATTLAELRDVIDAGEIALGIIEQIGADGRPLVVLRG